MEGSRASLTVFGSHRPLLGGSGSFLGDSREAGFSASGVIVTNCTQTQKWLI